MAAPFYPEFKPLSFNQYLPGKERKNLLAFYSSETASRLELTQPAVSIAARRGEVIVKQNSYSLFDK
jgi:hypothetical protein